MPYHPNYGALGRKISSIIQKFNNEMRYDAPKMSGQISSKEWLQSLNAHKERTFNKYQREAIAARNDYLDAKKSIDRKRQTVFFPKSTGYSEAEKQTALLERSLAIQQMQGGSLSEKALLKQIEDDFANGYIDRNGEKYNYLLSHNMNNLELQLKAISKLKEGFVARGLNEVEEIERDVDTAAGEFQELQKTFGV